MAARAAGAEMATDRGRWSPADVTGTSASTQLLSALRQTARILDQRTCRGRSSAPAVSIRVEPRFTRDVDVAVAVAMTLRRNRCGRLVRGFTLKLSLEQQALGRLATVRTLPPGQPEEGIVIDLLFPPLASSRRFCRDADRLEIAQDHRAVAQVGHLVAMKIWRSPGSTQDGVDLRALLAHLTRRNARARSEPWLASKSLAQPG